MSRSLTSLKMSVKNAAVCRLVCTEREPERERARDGGTESQGEKGVRYLRLGLRFPLGCRTVTDDRQAGRPRGRVSPVRVSNI